MGINPGEDHNIALVLYLFVAAIYLFIYLAKIFLPLMFRKKQKYSWLARADSFLCLGSSNPVMGKRQKQKNKRETNLETAVLAVQLESLTEETHFSGCQQQIRKNF